MTPEELQEQVESARNRLARLPKDRREALMAWSNALRERSRLTNREPVHVSESRDCGGW